MRKYPIFFSFVLMPLLLQVLTPGAFIIQLTRPKQLVFIFFIQLVSKVPTIIR
jgi:hypothetical protein